MVALNQFDQLSCFFGFGSTWVGSTFHFWINILDQHLDQHFIFGSTFWINILINISFLDQHFGSTSKLNWITMDQHPDQHRHLGILMKIHAIIAARHAVFCFILASSPHTVRFSISSRFHHVIPCGFLFRTDRSQMLISGWINIFYFGSTYWINIWINILDQHWLIKMLTQNVDQDVEQDVDPKKRGCWSKSAQMLIKMLIQMLIRIRKLRPRCHITRGFEIKVLRSRFFRPLDAKLIKLVNP